MSGYYNFPGISESVWIAFSDWIGYVKDDGSIGYILENGVLKAGDWSALAGKPSTFPPTIGSTATTAKAGNYTPSWSEINSVIPPGATFPPILGTSSIAAKPGNWYPNWNEIVNRPDLSDYVSSYQHMTEIVAAYTYVDDRCVAVEGQLAGKADLVYVDDELDLKANTSDVTSSLALKADTSSVTSGLALKANLTDIPNVTSKLDTPTVSYAARALNTIFQVSATRPAHVSYSPQITVTASIAGGQTGDVILEVSPSATFASGVQTVAIAGLGQTYTLAIALQGVQPQTGCVAGIVPAGWYARLRTVNVTGSPVFSVRATQEAIL